MERQTKNRLPFRHTKYSTVATISFLALSALLVYACIRLVGNVLNQELSRYAKPESQALLEQTATPILATATPEDVRSASAIYAPDTVTPPLLPEETPAVTPQPTPSLTPAPTLRPLAEPSTFKAGNLDFCVIGFDTGNRADWITLVRVRGNDCTVLSVPRNTLSKDETPLYTATTPRAGLQLLTSVFPVRYRYFVQLDIPGITACVDAFDGIMLNGAIRTGAEVASYLQSGSDELLRIERQQEVMRAYLSVLKSAGWLKLLQNKRTLQKTMDSNFNAAHLLELYAFLKQMNPDQITFLTLPVDSTVVREQRYYVGDAVRINQIVEKQFLS
ncbi:MAG: hypothetical protein RRZ24_05085 [Clostridia bacterium]